MMFTFAISAPTTQQNRKLRELSQSHSDCNGSSKQTRFALNLASRERQQSKITVFTTQRPRRESFDIAHRFGKAYLSKTCYLFLIRAILLVLILLPRIDKIVFQLLLYRVVGFFFIMSTLPKVRVKTRGNKLIIKANTLPKSAKSSAVLTLSSRKDPNSPSQNGKNNNNNNNRTVNNNNTKNTILKYTGQEFHQAK